MKASCLSLLCCIALACMGCTATPRYHLASLDPEALSDITSASYNFSLNEDVPPHVERTPDREADRQMAVAIRSAQAGQPSVGSPGVALAGSIISSVIVSSFNEHSQQQDANDRAGGLLDDEHIEKLNHLLIETFTHKPKHLAAIQIMPEGPTGHSLQFETSSDIRFGYDLSTLKLRYHVVLKDGEQTVYQNSFEFWSDPFPANMPMADKVNAWSKNEGQLLKEWLVQARDNIYLLVGRDLNLTGKHSQTKAKSFHYHNSAGTFFERGTVLQEKNGTIIYRDLRGNLRLVHGSMKRTESLLSAS